MSAVPVDATASGADPRIRVTTRDSKHPAMGAQAGDPVRWPRSSLCPICGMVHEEGRP